MNLDDLTHEQRTYVLGSGIYSARGGNIHDDINDSVATDDSIHDRMSRRQYL